MKKTGSSLRSSLLAGGGETAKPYTYLSLLPAAAVLAAGVTGLMKDAFSSWNVSVPAGVGVVCALCALLLPLYAGRLRNWVLPGGIALLGLVSAALFSRAKGGFLLLYNDFSAFLTGKSGRVELDFNTFGSDGRVAAVLLLALLSLLITHALASGKMGGTLPALFSALLLEIVGFGELRWPLPVFLAGMLLVWSRSLSDGEERGKTLRMLPTVAGLTVLAWLLALLVPISASDTLVRSWERKLHTLRYDETGSMPEGQLSNLGRWKKTDHAALELTMEEPQKLYLRGHTYENYTGTAWEKTDGEDAAEYESLFYWLHQDGFFAQSMLSGAQSAVEEVQGKAMTVRTLGACRECAYLPYALYGNRLLDPEQIGDAFARGGEELSFSLLSGSVPEWYGVQQKLAALQNSERVKQYLAEESAYRAYVQNTDLQLTPQVRETLRIYLGESGERRTLSEIKTLILDCLTDTLHYDENAAVRSGKSDFLSYVLRQQSGGYSVHYATAATLMLRYLGVPARYVEGYFLSAEEAEKFGGGDVICLTENHAHAWSEYYLDGVGWIPFEVTPGYIDEEELSLEVISQQEKSYEAPPPPVENEPTSPQQLLPREKLLRGGIILLIVLPVLLLLGALALLLWRKKRTEKRLAAIRAGEHRAAVSGLYGYGELLRKKGASCDSALTAEADRLNREAVFSLHPMGQGERDTIEQYVGELRQYAKEHWNARRKWQCAWRDGIWL